MVINVCVHSRPPIGLDHPLFCFELSLMTIHDVAMDVLNELGHHCLWYDDNWVILPMPVHPPPQNVIVQEALRSDFLGPVFKFLGLRWIDVIVQEVPDCYAQTIFHL